jgi:hypothetical protein
LLGKAPEAQAPARLAEQEACRALSSPGLPVPPLLLLLLPEEELRLPGGGEEGEEVPESPEHCLNFMRSCSARWPRSAGSREEQEEPIKS